MCCSDPQNGQHFDLLTLRRRRHLQTLQVEREPTRPDSSSSRSRLQLWNGIYFFTRISISGSIRSYLLLLNHTPFSYPLTIRGSTRRTV